MDQGNADKSQDAILAGQLDDLLRAAPSHAGLVIRLADEVSEERLDALVISVAEGLREAGANKAQRPESEGSQGGKGDPFTVGALLLVVLPTVLPQVVVFLNEVLGKAPQRRIRIKAKNGAEIEFTADRPITPEEAITLARNLGERS